ncbi:CMP-N-acetylneuraminate-beta-galactosamide-alpha-2,3-sialyltransferase 4 isoform X3 [Ctenopharyngodon idella]|uniref:CMP-N-acetylneuraminate-beta-galactosamide- alpha-2,3-sialyltransferase 4 isoform X3 n=1 Tax=Ctenopharyngodon idella TaxID=7959 RepID=UPI0022302AF2|nr:CMP-N-acetylneuraminate-beta-galactosamide-alpha-2,3-sialyltransferase 4 isoform X3 [Ctenopharyngodon idella]
MTLKAAKTWFFRLLPVVLFFICYYCSQFYFESYGGSGKSPEPTVSLCHNYRLQRKWESLKFNVSRKTELFLKLEDFFWRQHLSAEALPYGIKGSELLLLKVLAVISRYTMPANIESSLDCRTCAVIGNGFSIKNRSLGEIINKYDVVIRLNDAPVRGFEEDVGNKTTLRLFYPESASYNPGVHNDPDTLLVLVPFKQQDLRWLKEILYDEKRVRKGFWKPPPQIWLGQASQIRVLDPYFLRLTASKLLQIPLQPRRQQGFASRLLLKDGTVASLFGPASSSSELQPVSMINNCCCYVLCSVHNTYLVVFVVYAPCSL